VSLHTHAHTHTRGWVKEVIVVYMCEDMHTRRERRIYMYLMIFLFKVKNERKSKKEREDKKRKNKSRWKQVCVCVCVCVCENRGSVVRGYFFCFSSHFAHLFFPFFSIHTFSTPKSLYSHSSSSLVNFLSVMVIDIFPSGK
jgi:hypothetical protein